MKSGPAYVTAIKGNDDATARYEAIGEKWKIDKAGGSAQNCSRSGGRGQDKRLITRVIHFHSLGDDLLRRKYAQCPFFSCLAQCTAALASTRLLGAV